jgi:hypothetical protein
VSDVQQSVPDPDDEQAVAEELDEDRFDGDITDYPPDHALASREAAAPIETGDVPQDSLEERIWREEPDELPPRDEPVLLADPDADELQPDEVDRLDEEKQLLGQDIDPEDTPSAEEAAVHVVDDR